MMEAGRELDLLIADHVITYNREDCVQVLPVPTFSSDITEAMLVVEELQARVAKVGLGERDGFRMEWNGTNWHVGFTESMDADCMASHFEYDQARCKVETFSPCTSQSLPHAICLYALKIYGIHPGTPSASNPKAPSGDSGTK